MPLTQPSHQTPGPQGAAPTSSIAALTAAMDEHSDDGRCDQIAGVTAASRLVSASKRFGCRGRAAWACVADPFLFDAAAGESWAAAVSEVTGCPAPRIAAVLAAQKPSRSLPSKVAAAVVERLAVLGFDDTLEVVLVGESRKTVLEANRVPAVRHTPEPGSGGGDTQPPASVLGRHFSELLGSLEEDLDPGPEGAVLSVGQLFARTLDRGWVRGPGLGRPVVSGEDWADLNASLTEGFPTIPAAFAVELVGDPRFETLDPHRRGFNVSEAVETLNALCVEPLGAGRAAAELSSVLGACQAFVDLDPLRRALLVAWSAVADRSPWDLQVEFVFSGWSCDVEAALGLLGAAMSTPMSLGAPVSPLPWGAPRGASADLAVGCARLLRWLAAADPSLASDPARIGALFGVDDLRAVPQVRAGALVQVLAALGGSSGALFGAPRSAFFAGPGGARLAELVVAIVEEFTAGGTRDRSGLGELAATGVLSAPASFAMTSPLEWHLLHGPVRAGRWSPEELSTATRLHPDAAQGVARWVVMHLDGYEDRGVADWALDLAPLSDAVAVECEGSPAMLAAGRYLRPPSLRVAPAGSVRARMVAASSALTGEPLEAFWSLADSFSGTPEALAGVASSVTC